MCRKEFRIVNDAACANFVIHRGAFTAGEIIATAIFSLTPFRYADDTVDICRTDERELRYAWPGAVRCNIGGEYSPDGLKFDRFAPDFLDKSRHIGAKYYGIRSHNGTPYGTAGAFWKFFHMDILRDFSCPEDRLKDAAAMVDAWMIEGVDARELSLAGYNIQMSISDALEIFNDPGNATTDEHFLQTCIMAQHVLARRISTIIDTF